MDIKTTVYNCKFCNAIATKQQQELLVMKPSPSWPFQQICANYIECNNHHYLAIVDNLSGLLNIYHFLLSEVVTKTLIATLRALLVSYRIP